MACSCMVCWVSHGSYTWWLRSGHPFDGWGPELANGGVTFIIHSWQYQVVVRVCNIKTQAWFRLIQCSSSCNFYNSSVFSLTHATEGLVSEPTLPVAEKEPGNSSPSIQWAVEERIFLKKSCTASEILSITEKSGNMARVGVFVLFCFWDMVQNLCRISGDFWSWKHRAEKWWMATQLPTAWTVCVFFNSHKGIAFKKSCIDVPQDS